MTGTDDAYKQTMDYLYSRLPMFSRIGKAALKPDLTNTLKLCEAACNPHLKFKSVHIAGTNGKGSTSHALAATLQKNGYKTGLYTSPHLLDFRERICINGEQIGKEWVINFVNQYKEVIEQVMPSFFEITVVMAFLAFAEEKVDIAVIETGLGGRLDSTNIITPLVSVITNISYDHKDLLGNTLGEIAHEKAGIIKPYIPTVIGEQNDETEKVFLEHSIIKHSPLYYAETLWEIVRMKQDPEYCYYKVVDKARMKIYDLKTDLTGSYQQHNIKTVLTTLELLSHAGYELPMNTCLSALAEVKKLTGLRGRWDKLQESPIIICDVAHNPAGLQETLLQWKQLPANKKHIIIGFVKDKDVREALSLFPKDNVYYYCNAQIPRALLAGELKELALSMGLSGEAYPTVDEALTVAKKQMATEDALLITGSFFVVGEAMESRLHT